MGVKSDIQWTDASWTPLRARVKDDAGVIATAKGYTSLVQIATKMQGCVGPHCEHVSDGCTNCYSETNSSRCLTHNGTGLPFDRRSRDLVDPFVDEKILLQPLSWKKPRKVFVCSQTDLFGEWITDEAIDRVFAVMTLCPRHTFQVLTKRPERMMKWASGYRCESVMTSMRRMGIDVAAIRWPLPNVWPGVSCENEETADERIMHLLNTPAAVRFVSYEPALGPIDFTRIATGSSFHSTVNVLSGYACGEEPDEGDEDFGDRGDHGIDWLIVGGESGPGARPFDIAWARNAVEQCEAAGVACFVKQLGARPYPGSLRNGGRMPEIALKDRNGGDMSEWPEDLRVRQFPEVSR